MTQPRKTPGSEKLLWVLVGAAIVMVVLTCCLCLASIGYARTGGLR